MIQTAPAATLQALEHTFELGDLAAIEKQLSQTEKQYPQDVHVAVAKARLTAARGDTHAAEVSLQGLQRAHPKDPHVLAYLGALYVAEKKYSVGKPLLEQALSSGGSVPAAHHALGVALAKDKKYTQALFHLGTAAKAMPSSAPTFYYLGACFAELRRFDDAAKALAHCVELSSKYVAGWNALARVEVELGRPDVAVKLLNEGLKHNPGNVSLQWLKISVHLDFGQAQEALTALQHLPASAVTAEDHAAMAKACLALKHPKESLQHARDALKKDPHSSAAHFAHGLALEEQTPMHAAEVIAAYEKAVAAGDPTGEAATRLGYVLTATGKGDDVTKAIGVLQKALEKNRSAPATLLHLALAHAKIGNKAEAQKSAKAVVASTHASINVKEQAQRLLKVL